MKKLLIILFVLVTSLSYGQFSGKWSLAPNKLQIPRNQDTLYFYFESSGQAVIRSSKGMVFRPNNNVGISIDTVGKVTVNNILVDTLFFGDGSYQVSAGGSAIETDPIWSASPSHSITNTNISNWNTAYGWGNHATAGYLTSYTETDPIFASDSAKILHFADTLSKIATRYDLTSISVDSSIYATKYDLDTLKTFNHNLTVTGNIIMSENKRIEYLGSSNNIGIGNYSNTSTTAESAISLGEYSGYSGSGANNIHIGKSAGFENSGNNNVHLGSSGSAQNSGDSCILIGNSLTAGNTTTNKIVIGNGTNPLLSGVNNSYLNINGNTTINGNATVRDTLKVLRRIGINSSNYLSNLCAVGDITTGRTNQMFNFTTNTTNKQRNTWANATDTSSFNFKFTNLGKPQFNIMSEIGNPLFYLDTSASTPTNRFYISSGLGTMAENLRGSPSIFTITHKANSGLGLSIVNTTTSGGAGGAQMELCSHDGALLAKDDRLGIIYFKGSISASTAPQAFAQISSFVDETPSASNDHPSRLVLSTKLDGTTTLFDRIIIRNNGVIGTTPINTGNITAGTGITATMLSQDMRYNGASAIDITANPQIVAGNDGDVIEITGTSDANTLKLDDGTGLQLAGGASFTIGAGDVISLKFNGTVWVERFRSDN